MRFRTTLLVTCLALAIDSPAGAQSLFATRGLGVPIAPVGARARSLGGIGLGLLGFDLSIGSPADVAGLGRRGIMSALQPGSATPSIGEQKGSVAAARFPLIRLVYPMTPRLAFSLGYGSFLEQSWAVEIEGTEVIGSDTVPTRDVIRASGAVARVGLGASYQLSPSLSLGVTAGLYTGNLDRRVSRTFSDSTIGLSEFDTQLQWDYSGQFASAGVRFDMADILRASASFTVSSDLDVNALEGDARDDRAKLPFMFAAGASGALSSNLAMTAAAEWSGGAAGRLFQAQDAVSMARDTWRVGGGFEYTGWRGATRNYPIRLGASWAQLPYYDEGESPASEWATALGLGFHVIGDAASPLAVLDMSIERGNRSGLESVNNPGGLSESFWRWTFSLSLFGL